MAIIIPFVKDKKKRDEMKKEYEKGYTYVAESNIKKHLDSINQKMEEIRQMAQLSETESARVGLPPPPVPPTAGTLNEKELEKEYKRKKEDAEQRRKETNRKVTRDYSLLGPRGRDR